jgi:hypothetical protein
VTRGQRGEGSRKSVTLRLPQPFTKAPALDPLSCGASSYAAREASHPLAGFLFNDRLSPFPLWKLTSEPWSSGALFFGDQADPLAACGLYGVKTPVATIVAWIESRKKFVAEM